jgi:hypothetical protein
MLEAAVHTCLVVNPGMSFIFIMEPANAGDYPLGAGYLGGLSADTSEWSQARSAFYAVQSLFPDSVAVVDFDYYLAAHKFSANYHDYTFAIATGGTGYVVNDTVTPVQPLASGGVLTVSSVGTGGVITGITVTNEGTQYRLTGGILPSSISSTGGTGSGATFTVVPNPNNPHPQNNGYGDGYLSASHYATQQFGLPFPKQTWPAWDKRPELAGQVTSATEPMCAPVGTLWQDTSNASTPLVKVKVGQVDSLTPEATAFPNFATSGCGPGIWNLQSPSNTAVTNLVSLTGIFSTNGVAPDGTTSASIISTDPNILSGGGYLTSSLTPTQLAGQTLTFSAVFKDNDASQNPDAVQIVLGNKFGSGGWPGVHIWSPSQGWVTTANKYTMTTSTPRTTIEPHRVSITFTMPSVATLTSWTGSSFDVSTLQVMMAGFNAPATLIVSDVMLVQGASALHGLSGGSTLVPFNSVTGGTNTSAAMLVGTGASLAPTGSGAITATGIAGGAVGSMHYQSAANTTATLAGNTTTAPAVLMQTGTGSASSAPAWTAATGTGSPVLSASPTLTGLPVVPSGNATTPGIQVGAAGYGISNYAGNQIDVVVGGVTNFQFLSSGPTMPTGMTAGGIWQFGNAPITPQGNTTTPGLQIGSAGYGLSNYAGNQLDVVIAGALGLQMGGNYLRLYSGSNYTGWQNDTLSAGRTLTTPDGASYSVLVASLTTTAATSDNLTIQGMLSTGHCSLTATNASAATNLSTSYVSAKTTNQVTVTHTATASMTYDLMCTSH